MKRFLSATCEAFSTLYYDLRRTFRRFARNMQFAFTGKIPDYGQHAEQAQSTGNYIPYHKKRRRGCRGGKHHRKHHRNEQ